MGGIGREAGGTSPPAEVEWSVHLALSVYQIVPYSVLSGWIAVETFVRANESHACWPGNRALAERMQVGSVNAAQAIVLRLEDHGILERHDQGGNNRVIRLHRRTSQPITSAEWSAMVARADQLRAKRAEAAARRKRPAHPPSADGALLLSEEAHPPSADGAYPPSQDGAPLRRRRTGKKPQQQRAAQSVELA
jgi:hypothetical protein